jgi:hypothetical protein
MTQEEIDKLYDMTGKIYDKDTLNIHRMVGKLDSDRRRRIEKRFDEILEKLGISPTDFIFLNKFLFSFDIDELLDIMDKSNCENVCNCHHQSNKVKVKETNITKNN